MEKINYPLYLVVKIKDAGNKEKIEHIKRSVQRNNFYFYTGGEMDLGEKVQYGYNRLSSIAGNMYPIEMKKWFNQLVGKQKIDKQQSKQIERIVQRVFEGNAIVNLKKALNDKGIPIGICRSPIGIN